MGYFSDITDGSLTEKELSVRGKTKPTFWKHLTAGQRVELLRRQVVKSDGSEMRIIEVNLAESAERNQRLVQMTLCDRNGNPVYGSLKELQEEPDWLVSALGALANNVHSEADEGKS